MQTCKFYFGYRCLHIVKLLLLVPFFPWLFFLNLWEAFIVFWKCPRNLCCVGVVNDYVDTVSVFVDYAHTVSAWSTTTPTLCPRGNWLRPHCVLIVKDYFSICHWSQWLHQHGVTIVNDYTDMQFLKISNYICVTFFVSFLLFPK